MFLSGCEYTYLFPVNCPKGEGLSCLMQRALNRISSELICILYPYYLSTDHMQFATQLKSSPERIKSRYKE